MSVGVIVRVIKVLGNIAVAVDEIILGDQAGPRKTSWEVRNPGSIMAHDHPRPLLPSGERPGVELVDLTKEGP